MKKSYGANCSRQSKQKLSRCQCTVLERVPVDKQTRRTSPPRSPKKKKKKKIERERRPVGRVHKTFYARYTNSGGENFPFSTRRTRAYTVPVNIYPQRGVF